MAFGGIIRSANAPSTFPQGIGGKTDVIWHCDDGAGQLIYELSTTGFSVVRSASNPSTGARGIGGDADTIWHCDINENKVYELSTTDFSVARSATSPSNLAYGIGGDASVIWHTDYQTDRIYELAVLDFSVVRSALSPSTIPRGVGGDSSNIWHCDGNLDRIYELSTLDFSVVQWEVTPDVFPQGIGGDANTIWHCGYGIADDGSIYELAETAAVAPTVTTDLASLILSFQATLNGTLDDDGDEACDCGFEWGLTNAYGETTPTQSRNTGQTFTQLITPLSASTIYHFRAFATNTAGTSYGADRTFATLSGQDSVDQTIIGNKVSLEAIRNIEIVYGGRFYIDKSGNAVYESRYHRNV